MTAEDRGDTIELLLRAASTTVPPGTRAIRVTMTATKFAGAYNDAYLASISLSLVPPPPGDELPPPAIGKAVDVLLVSGQGSAQGPGVAQSARKE